MRFSLKRLLAATAYAAVVCASVRFANKSWATSIGLAVTGWFTFAVLAAIVRKNRTRAFFAGVALFASVGVAMLYSDSSPFGDFPGVSTARTAICNWLGALLLPYEGEVEQFALASLQQRYAGRGGEGLEVIAIDRANPLGVNIEFMLNGIKGTRGVSLLDGPNGLWASDALAVVRFHLILLFSLLGGLLGLWFRRNEEVLKPLAGSPSTTGVSSECG